MENRLIWVINNGPTEQEICVQEWGRFVTFVPGRPQQVPEPIALQLVTQFYNMKQCPNPEAYFNDRPQKVLIQRDNGIGDLLLLEPLIRAMKTEKNRIISVLTVNPDVYLHNPYIDNLIKADHKDAVPIHPVDYDFWHDFRNYSEQHPERSKKHRTDIYAFKTGTELKDKNPRIYLDKNETNTAFKKEEGKTYIGIACDGSHLYRRYYKGRELIKHILISDLNAVVVIFGSWDYVKVDADERVIDLQKKTTVREMILAVRDLDFLISVDTGIMHVGMSLHVPTVGIFSICSPEFRVTNYDGPKKILCRKDLTCIGCGDNHMVCCRHGDKQKNEAFEIPCLNWKPEQIYNALKELPKSSERRCFYPEKDEIKTVNVNLLPEKKLTMPIIVQDEELNLPRFIELVIKDKSIGRVIAIDGGSTDKTVELLEKAGAEVYHHPYIKTYHNQQATQREISCSYVAENTNIIIMDIDEVFSKELSDYLPYLAEQSQYQYGVIYRRTFNKFEDINDISKSIKNFPDPQPRFYIWQKRFKFVNGAHHITLNVPAPLVIKQPILHYENQNGRRNELESQWNSMMQEVRQIG